MRLPRALVIVNTRELALQLEDNFNQYAEGKNLSSVLLIGGVGTSKQGQKLSKGVDVIIATPGCLLDHLVNGRAILSDIALFVIDEADRMLDMGFIPDVKRICSYLPAKRQSLMFSATMAPDVEVLADELMSNPKKVYVSPQSTVSANIMQSIIKVDKPIQKFKQIATLLKDKKTKNALIFCNRKRDVAKLNEYLVKEQISVAALHGDMSQHLRLACLKRFRDGEVPFLVCSDVAARGLDIPAVSHIFNFDLPDNPEDYVHRIGRTGRAGKKGFAISFVLPDDEKIVQLIEALPGASLQIDSPALEEDKTPPSKKRKPHALPHRIKSQKNDPDNPFGHPDNVPDFLKFPTN